MGSGGWPHWFQKDVSYEKNDPNSYLNYYNSKQFHRVSMVSLSGLVSRCPQYSMMFIFWIMSWNEMKYKAGYALRHGYLVTDRYPEVLSQIQ